MWMLLSSVNLYIQPAWLKSASKQEYFLYRDLLKGRINQINPLTCVTGLLQCPFLVQSGLSVFKKRKEKKKI